MKNSIIIAIVIVVMVGLGLFIFSQTSRDKVETPEQESVIETEESENLTEEGQMEDGTLKQGRSIIGSSVEGREIESYTFGSGENHLLFVGGIHGGYSWNTALVAYELVDYLEKNPNALPQNLKVSVIPVLNPDGLNKVVGTSGRFSASSVPVSTDESVPGRFNANNVDLNRNFDCEWQENATWQNKTVSGGRAPFSEPESLAFKNFVEANKPDLAVVWYSAVGGVFASNCRNGVLPETSEATNIYAKASGYRAYEEFNFYEITGDMTNWLAKIKIPAISVLLTNHRDVEWDKNLKGIQALFGHYNN